MGVTTTADTEFSKIISTFVVALKVKSVEVTVVEAGY